METNGSDVRKSWLVAPAVQEKVETRKRAEEQPLQNDRKGSPSRTKNYCSLTSKRVSGSGCPGRHSGMRWVIFMYSWGCRWPSVQNLNQSTGEMVVGEVAGQGMQTAPNWILVVLP